MCLRELLSAESQARNIFGSPRRRLGATTLIVTISKWLKIGPRQVERLVLGFTAWLINLRHRPAAFCQTVSHIIQ